MRGNSESVAYWFIIVRIVTCSIILIGFAVFWGSGLLTLSDPYIFFTLLPGYLLINILWFFLRGKAHLHRIILDVQLIIDILAITFAVYFSGQYAAETALFYLLPIISATLISPFAPIAAGLTSLFLYESIIYAESYKLIPLPQSVYISPQNAYIVHLCVLAILTASIIFQNRYYFKNIQKKDVELAKFKDEFLFKTVHDLRTPATSLRWTTENLNELAKVDKYLGIRDDVARIREASAQIVRLIQDLMNIAKSSAPTYMVKITNISLPQLLVKIISELEPQTQEKKIIIEYRQKEIFPDVLADEDALKEIFINILDNAIKYNKTGGRIGISHFIEKNFLITVIQDSGKGIESEALNKIFTPYFRGENIKNLPGTGLGLYIVKELLRKMGGRIEVNSILGEGTTVNIILPIKQVYI